MSHIWRKPGLSPAARYAELWRELALCDALGFDYGFAVEHHFDPRESLSASPTLYIAAAAARTRRLRLGALGWVVPLYDPLRVVEEIVALDNALDGRLEVGLVSGALPIHFAPFKADFERRRERALEGYALLKAACASPDGFSFEGPFHSYMDVTLAMAPCQRPRPPVWFETRHPPTLEYLAAEGVHTGYVHYLPRADIAPLYADFVARWRQAGHAEQPNVNYWTFVYVDETDDRAWEVAGPSWAYTYSEIASLDDLIQSRRRRGELSGAALLEHFTDPAYLREHDIGLIGSPDTVAAKLCEYAHEGMFNTLLGEFNFGLLSEEQVLRSIRLFGEEVLPRLRDYEPY
jgi:alkanesulfonate monooxygenase SsuD/methylene tetrahydromethanopterin reductase-like flavin-dependent oxidoreductase (luciferase family)